MNLVLLSPKRESLLTAADLDGGRTGVQHREGVIRVQPIDEGKGKGISSARLQGVKNIH